MHLESGGVRGGESTVFADSSQEDKAGTFEVMMFQWNSYFCSTFVKSWWSYII